MEKLIILGAERFTLQPDPVEVFSWLACGPEVPCRPAFEAQWERAVSLLNACTSPCAAAAPHGEQELTVFLTLGPQAEEQIIQLFDRRDYILASLLSTLCDERLFQMDRQAAALLRPVLSAEHRYIAGRLEPGVDLSAAQLLPRLTPLQAALPWARVSPQGRLYPTKSMMYCLTLSHQDCKQTDLHDCARCDQPDCPYRDQPRRA